jgi:hypothetical protein
VSHEPEGRRQSYGFKPREFERLNDAPPAASQPAKPAAAAGDVRVMFGDNAARAKADGPRDGAPPPRRSKRARDYFAVLLVGNAALVGGYFLQPVFAAAGFVIFNVGLTWVMWFVMDDY